MSPATVPNQLENTTGTTRFNLEFAFKLLEDEFETLFALSTALRNQLERLDSECPKDDRDPVAMRLSQVLTEQLEKALFLDNMRELLLGPKQSNASEV